MVQQFLHAPKIQRIVSTNRLIEDKGPSWFTAARQTAAGCLRGEDDFMVVLTSACMQKQTPWLPWCRYQVGQAAVYLSRWQIWPSLAAFQTCKKMQSVRGSR